MNNNLSCVSLMCQLRWFPRVLLHAQHQKESGVCCDLILVWSPGNRLPGSSELPFLETISREFLSLHSFSQQLRIFKYFYSDLSTCHFRRKSNAYLTSASFLSGSVYHEADVVLNNCPIYQTLIHPRDSPVL